MHEEVWKDVVGFEDYFRVSTFGNVYSKRTGIILKQVLRVNGYKTISTRIGGRSGKALCFKVHRLVAEAFISNPQNKPEVNHKDGNKANNSVQNLEWNTKSENILHSYDTGLSKPIKGIENIRSTISEDDLNFIYLNSNKLGGDMSMRAIARHIGCSHKVVAKYIKRHLNK